VEVTPSLNICPPQPRPPQLQTPRPFTKSCFFLYKKNATMAPSAIGEIQDLHLLPCHSSTGTPTKPIVTPNTCLSSVLHGPLDLRLVRKIPRPLVSQGGRNSDQFQETRHIEEPALGELQIQIKSTGICGSDVSYYKKFANGV
jgi:L-iditol 2-dehydrogenase